MENRFQVENRSQLVGYAVLIVAGLCIAASVMSISLLPDIASVGTTAALAVLGVSLAVSAVLSTQRPAYAVASLPSRRAGA